MLSILGRWGRRACLPALTCGRSGHARIVLQSDGGLSTPTRCSCSAIIPITHCSKRVQAAWSSGQMQPALLPEPGRPRERHIAAVLNKLSLTRWSVSTSQSSCGCRPISAARVCCKEELKTCCRWQSHESGVTVKMNGRVPDVPLWEVAAAAAACAGLPFWDCWGPGGPGFGLPCCARALPGIGGGALLLMSAVASDAPRRSCTDESWLTVVLSPHTICNACVITDRCNAP